MTTYIIDEFRAAMQESGIEPPDIIHADGVLHRFRIPGHKSGTLNGAYKLHLTGAIPAGYFEDFKTGIKATWKAQGPAKPIPPEERARLEREQQKRKLKQLRRQENSLAHLKDLMKTAQKAPADQPYLIGKEILPHGALIGTWRRMMKDQHGNHKELLIENSLIVPMYDESLKLRSAQGIFPRTITEFGRNKDFWPGLPIAGLFWWIGAKSNPTFITEGFATGASLHEETGCCVFIAFTAGNLLTVGKIVRERLPDIELIFCADNDENTAGNPGVTKANEAALAVDAKVYVPPIAGDYNDYVIYKRRLENERG
jgi:putative DNA primase/helicase